MVQLVNLPNNVNGEPTTDSYIIAESLKRKHSNVTRLIKNHQKDFEDFGKVGFEIKPSFRSKQNIKAYILNEDQAMLLFTIMSNSPEIIRFKKQLIRNFRLMYNELFMLKAERLSGINQRLSITEAIKELIPESEHKKFLYSNYTNLIYKVCLDKPVKQIKIERSVPNNANFRDYLNKVELEQVAKTESLVTSLIEIGKDYQEIKSILL